MFIELHHPNQGATFVNVSTIHEFYPVYGMSDAEFEPGAEHEPITLALVLDRGAGSPMEFGYGTYRTQADAERAYAAVAKAMGGIGLADLQRGARAGM